MMQDTESSNFNGLYTVGGFFSTPRILTTRRCTDAFDRFLSEKQYTRYATL